MQNLASLDSWNQEQSEQYESLASTNVQSMDSVGIKSGNLEIYYQGSNWKENKLDSRLYKVKLN